LFWSLLLECVCVAIFLFFLCMDVWCRLLEVNGEWLVVVRFCDELCCYVMRVCYLLYTDWIVEWVLNDVFTSIFQKAKVKLKGVALQDDVLFSSGSYLITNTNGVCGSYSCSLILMHSTRSTSLVY